MTAWTIIEATQEEVRSGELGRRQRHVNHGFVGEYPNTQPVWLNAREMRKVECSEASRLYVFICWLHIDVLWVDEAAVG